MTSALSGGVKGNNMKKEKQNEGIAIFYKNPNFYKGYDMKWLAKEPQHPDYYLVAEFKAIKEKQND